MVSANVYNLTTEGALKVAANFKVSEFKSDSNIVLINSKLPAALQMIRDKIGKPVIITCAYRTEGHNKRVGGVVSSKHLYGMAADIYVSGMDERVLARTINSLFPKNYAIICYTKKHFVHFDVRDQKYRAINDGKERAVTAF